ncbi:MAG: hypothetical protein ACLFUU_13980 [Desulfobacteraceae bacterium]
MGRILYGRKDICNYLGVSWSTVKRWKRKKGFPLIQPPGLRPMVHTMFILAWVKALKEDEIKSNLPRKFRGGNCP